MISVDRLFDPSSVETESSVEIVLGPIRSDNLELTVSLAFRVLDTCSVAPKTEKESFDPNYTLNLSNIVRAPLGVFCSHHEIQY